MVDLSRGVGPKKTIYFHGLIHLLKSNRDYGLKFLEENSKSIAHKLKNSLENRLNGYSFESVPAYEVTEDMSRIGIKFLNLDKIVLNQSDVDIDADKITDLRIINGQGKVSGRIHMATGFDVMLGDFYGFNRKLSWEKTRLLSQIKEDVDVSSTVLQEGLKIFLHDYFPRCEKSVKSKKFEIGLDFKTGERLRKKVATKTIYEMAPYLYQASQM